MPSQTQQRRQDEVDIRPRLLFMAERVLYQFNRIFLRHGVIIPELQKILAWTGARAALREPEFAAPRREDRYMQNAAHAAVLSGLTRVQVKKAADSDDSPVSADGGDLHRLIRILTAWRSDAGYQDENGDPIPLRVRGPTPSLHQLCLKYGRDTTARAIADVLVRCGNAEWEDAQNPEKRGNRLLFIRSTVNAQHLSHVDIAIMTQIGSDFLHSFQEAFDGSVHPQPRFIEGYYNDVDPDRADEALAFLRKEIEEFNKRCLAGLRQYRLPAGRKGMRIGVGAYSFKNAELLLRSIGEASER